MNTCIASEMATKKIIFEKVPFFMDGFAKIVVIAK